CPSMFICGSVSAWARRPCHVVSTFSDRRLLCVLCVFAVNIFRVLAEGKTEGRIGWVLGVGRCGAEVDPPARQEASDALGDAGVPDEAGGRVNRDVEHGY